MNKQRILEEIRRTAKTNGGTPLGRERFERETGIKESDWSGKHWVRWGDALKEAGFEPNKMVSAHEEEFLLEQFISLVRELGRLPVNLELKMKRRSDSTFPSDKTFSRFGNKQQLIKKVAEYCRSKTGYEDVLFLCDATQTTAEANSVEEENDKEAEFGFVYLIKSGRHYKIGRSNAVGRREREIALQLPEKASTVHVIRTDDPVGIEAYWHQRFADRRKNGEWFELMAADVKAFRRRKFM